VSHLLGRFVLYFTLIEITPLCE